MKIKKLNLIFLTIPLAIFMCFCFLMPNIATSVYAETLVPQICDKHNDAVDETSYPYPIDENNGVDVTLGVINFDFEVDDVLIYHCLKLDSDSVVYIKLTEKIITENKAVLFQDIESFLKQMGWNNDVKTEPKQRELFIDLNEDEKRVVDILYNKDSIQVNLLALELNTPVTDLFFTLLELEMKNVVKALPGGLYKLI